MIFSTIIKGISKHVPSKAYEKGWTIMEPGKCGRYVLVPEFKYVGPGKWGKIQNDRVSTNQKSEPGKCGKGGGVGTR